jgi:hypothetical protein
MRAIDRFERFSRPTHNAQDYLKNHIFERYPVINSEEEIGDWEGSVDYVWLVDPDIQIYDSFPWYYKPRPNDEVAIHAFPYVFKESRKVYSWEKVRLVPTTPGSYNTLEHAHICGHYDPYKGKEKFDIFFLGKDKTVHDDLIDRGLDVQVVNSIQQAQDQSFTDMFWIVYDDTVVRNTFKFSYKPDEWSFDIPHVFGNGDIDQLDGIVLMPREYYISQKEADHRFFTNKKEIRIMASDPRSYDQFVINSYSDYKHALNVTTTDMFWGYSDKIIVNDEFKFDYYISHHSTDKKSNHAWLNGNKYDGVFLFSKKSPVSEEEIIFRQLKEKIDHKQIASVPKNFERFTVETYEEYLEALKSCGTDMMWLIPDDVEPCKDFIWDSYFHEQETIDLSTNHVFLNGENFDGIALLTTAMQITEKEFEHRFYVNKKEHNVIASNPKKYPVFTINNYEDYTEALYNTHTEMFWGVPSDVEIKDDFDFNITFSHQNKYDRNINHVFLNNEHYDGIVLYSKNVLVSEKEIEHRFLVKKKEWDIVASTPKQYPIYTVNNYQDYIQAKQDCNTDMFWIVNDNILPNEDFDWNFYISHHNQYERKINHVWRNGEYYDGVALISKKLNISQREIDYRFFITKKEYKETASLPKPYDIVFISNGEPNADENYALLCDKFPRAKRVMDIKGIHAAHKRAAELVETEMFWVVDGDAEIIDGFEFDHYVPAYDIDGKDTVHVWRSFNPVNGLVYGYGGVKLLPTVLTRNMDESTTDMTTSISDKFKGVDEMSNTTAFNTDAFSAWRSGFRECCKLASKVIDRQKDDETEFRLQAWCTRGDDKPFGKAAINGAINGKKYGEENQGNAEALAKINDFDWLQEQFKLLYQQV